MTSELSRKINHIMTREMGQLGEFIVGKQCKDLEIDKDEIQPADQIRLADALGQVMVTFGGPDKAKLIRDEIKRIEL